MLHTIQECRDTARMLEDRSKKSGLPPEHPDNPFYAELHLALTDNHIEPLNVALADLCEAFLGRDALERMNPRYRPNQGFMLEAGDVVNTGAFSNIIGQITYTTVLAQLENADHVGMGLVTTDPGTTQYEEIVPGVGGIGDRAEDVGEGENYPTVGLSEEFIEIPRKVKDGFVLPVTEEAIWEDKTGGLLMQRANAAAESMGITMEKAALSTALGVTNTYKRNNVTRNTYLDTGGFDNLIVDVLDDYTDINAALLLFDAIDDPNTGEPINVAGQMQLVVPPALYMTALAILNATELKIGADSGAVQQMTNNLLQVQTRRRFTVVSNQYVKEATNSDIIWFLGKFPDAFGYREIWPLQVYRQDRTSEAGFARDVVTQIKVRRKGVFYVREPRKVVKSTGVGV